MYRRQHPTPMIILNHQHLYYFWVVAKEGSVAKACEKLYLAQPTVSGQIIQLEKFLGRTLFSRKNKKMALTEDGELVFGYADRIFDFSRELMDAVQDRSGRRVVRMQLGIVPQVPLQLAERLLDQLYRYRPRVQPTIIEGPLKFLLNGLKTHELDLVFSHVPAPESEGSGYVQVQVGELPIDFVAAPALAAKIKRFPEDLTALPLLMPARPNPVRDQVEHYLFEHDCKPETVGEAQDVELMRFMVRKGVGAAPMIRSVVAEDVRAGTIVRLNRKPTGLVKTEWLIARKRHAMNPVARFLLQRFRLKP